MSKAGTTNMANPHKGWKVRYYRLVSLIIREKPQFGSDDLHAYCYINGKRTYWRWPEMSPKAIREGASLYPLDKFLADLKEGLDWFFSAELFPDNTTEQLTGTKHNIYLIILRHGVHRQSPRAIAKEFDQPYRHIRNITSIFWREAELFHAVAYQHATAMRKRYDPEDVRDEGLDFLRSLDDKARILFP